MKKVFLGGTCNNSNWRDILIPKLKIDYFNPVVDNWTPECMKEEVRQREMCDYCLYVITSEMLGVYSIAEVVDDSNKRSRKTILCVLEDGFNDYQIKSLRQVGAMIQDNGGMYFNNLEKTINYLNQGVK
ncbi:MAG: nucleoside 2-deoxyribosyltransferase domain-containing protein [Candidatus Hodarchaeota archaeon]